MKHNINIVIILISLFFLSQLVGMIFVAGDINTIVKIDGGQEVIHNDTAIGERPEISGMSSLFYISFGIFLGTLIILMLIKFKAKKIWVFWYFLAVFMAMTIALGVFLASHIAIGLGLILALLKVFKQNIFTHNITEILVYSGLAVLFVPLFDVFWTIILLFIISLYDMYAVWQSKHMVKLAQFTTESKLFAGFSIGYHKQKKGTKVLTKLPKQKYKTQKSEHKTAILGGGDIFFALLFTGVVMEYLVKLGHTLVSSYFISIIVVICTTGALSWLFYKSEKGKYYPAMPYISAGCILGFLLVKGLIYFL